MRRARVADIMGRYFPRELPALTGKRFIVYRILWSTMLVAALASLSFAAFGTRQPLPVLLLGLQGAFLTTVAVILARRRPRDPIAAMLSMAFLLWAITGAVEGKDLGAADAWVEALDRLRFLLLVAAVMLFPSGQFQPRWTAPALAAAAIVFLVGLGNTAGLLPEGLFLPPAVLCVVAAIFALITRLRRVPPGSQRQQLKWVAFGLAAGLSLILVYRVGSAIASEPADVRLFLESCFRLGVMMMAVGFLVSLLRYRLYDAEAAISRSAAYVALTLSLLGVFAASEATIELLGQRYIGGQAGDFSGGIAAAIAAVLIAPLHERITGWAERRFQRDLVVLREELPRLLADAQDHADLAGLSAIILPRLEAGVRALHVALAINREIVAVNDIAVQTARHWTEHWAAPSRADSLDRDPEDPLFPLRIALTCAKGTQIGWVLLGPRPDGSFYRQDELEALAEIAAPLRRAVVAVRQRELAETEARAWKDGVQGDLARLADRIAALENAPRSHPR